jgi:ribosomal protein S18 acetylase RimI-like enzyme
MLISLIIREYTPDDYNEIVEISSHIWDGHDYLPARINEFYSDPNSFPMVIESNGIVVTVGNMRRLTDKIMWLEAIRTHPDARGKGFGTDLTQKQLEYASQMGNTHVWLFTAKKNRATEKILTRLGFDEKELFKHWEPKEVTYFSTFENGLSKSGKLLDLEYLPEHCSKASYDKSTAWELCETEEMVSQQVRRLQDNGNSGLIIGEFLAYPFPFLNNEIWVNGAEIYYLDDPLALLTLRNSTEEEALIICGISTNDPISIELGMIFARNKYPNHKIEVFYQHHIENKLFDGSESVFRLMVKEL